MFENPHRRFKFDLFRKVSIQYSILLLYITASKKLRQGFLRLGSRSDVRLELPSLLEKPSGNYQMTHIIQNPFYDKQINFNFLAAMSSSRSDVVTHCVLPSVCPFFSFSVLEVSSSPKEFQWCFKKVIIIHSTSADASPDVSSDMSEERF